MVVLSRIGYFLTRIVYFYATIEKFLFKNRVFFQKLGIFDKNWYFHAIIGNFCKELGVFAKNSVLLCNY